MRIIAGKAKGRQLDSIKNSQVRPTQDRVKEAIFKAFGVGVFKYPGNEIEIKADGPPEASFYGDLADLSKRIGVENVSISISYDGDYAVGIAILES